MNLIDFIMVLESCISEVACAKNDVFLIHYDEFYVH